RLQGRPRSGRRALGARHRPRPVPRRPAPPTGGPPTSIDGTVNKLFASLLALVLAVVVLVGCGSVTPYAATVNTERLTHSDLESELAAISGNNDYVKLLEQGQPPIAVRGKGKGTFDQTFVARVLTREIFYRLVRDEIGRRKLTVDNATLGAARQSVVQQVGGDNVLAKFPTGYRTSLVRRTAELETLTKALAKA